MPAVDLYPVPLGLAALLASHGLRRGSLAPSGAAAAFAVGYATLACPTPAFGSMLLAFYLAGSRATRIKAEVKATLELEAGDERPSRDHAKQPAHKAQAGGQRDATQVLCNSLFGAAAACTYRVLFSGAPAATSQLAHTLRSIVASLGGPRAGPELHAQTLLLLALGHFACCTGDTLASELGILSRSRPRLVTTGQTVPPGTNGGVSLLGVACSIGGGALMGLVCGAALYASDTAMAPSKALSLLLIGAAAGGTGSMIDSLLGATLQRTWYSETRRQVLVGRRPPPPSSEWRVVTGYDVCSNSAVNLISSLATAVLTARLGNAVLAN